jgi:hypothetical protein
MNDARGEKLDVMLRSRLVEPFDPDLVTRIVAKSKDFGTDSENSSFRRAETLAPL